MNCIIFDLEWNEIVPYQLAMQNEIGFPLSGEIIEIGAVRMTGDGFTKRSLRSLGEAEFSAPDASARQAIDGDYLGDAAGGRRFQNRHDGI